jgi:hypothetical protein
MLNNCLVTEYISDDPDMPTAALIEAAWQRATAERELLAKIRVEAAIDAARAAIKRWACRKAQPK